MIVEMSRLQVEERFEEAAVTLRRLPDPPGSGPKGYGASWPDYVRGPWHAYGYHAARMRVVPSAAEISRMEEALEWLAWLDPVDARIVWFRSGGERWQKIARREGLSRSACWRRFVAAQMSVVRRLRAGVPPAKKKARPGAGGP